MRIVRNIGHVRRRKRLARWSALVGFLMLASTFALVFVPQFVAIAYVLLLFGFVLFNIGMQQLGKWSHNARHQRDDLALDEKLASLSDRFTLLHYVKVGKEIIEHLLIYPGGVLVITTRDLPGRIQARGNRWKRKGVGALRLFGLSGPQLGNPSFDLERSLAALDKRLAEAQMQVETSGVIVFTSSLVDLDVEDTDYPALELSELPEVVRHLELDPTFKTPERDALIALLATGEELERTEPSSTRRPVKVKRRAAPVREARS
jgi:hypothetical protein